MTEWPPRDAEELREWLDNDLQTWRERRRLLVERIANATSIMQSPRWSHIRIARTSVSDPTGRIARRWIEELPTVREELAVIDAMLEEYRIAKVGLDTDRLKVIEGTYDLHLGPAEIYESIGISRSTFYEYLRDARERMLAVLRFRAEMRGQNVGQTSDKNPA